MNKIIYKLIKCYSKWSYLKLTMKYKTENKYLNESTYVFIGDSITEWFDKLSRYQTNKIINRGIRGDTTLGVINRLENDVLQLKPIKVFILIGTNDYVFTNLKTNGIFENIKIIIEKIKMNLPNTKIYVQAIYPVNETINKMKFNIVDIRRNEEIIKLNNLLEKWCHANKVNFIDNTNLLKNHEGKLNELYTNDGLHLNEKGYNIVYNNLLKYLEE